MNSFLFIDLDLMEWNGKGDLPVPHFKAMKFSNFLKLKGNRTDLIYKTSQLELIDSYDFLIVCTQFERLLPDFLLNKPNKKILTFDSQLDFQIEYMGVDENLYGDMVQEFLFERNYSVNRLMWHSAASLIQVSKDEEIVHLVDDLYTKSKNYICIYDRDFLSLEGWQDVICELEEKQKKYRFAFPLNIDSIENIEDAILLSECSYMTDTKFIFYQKINNDMKKLILELNRYSRQSFIFNTPNFEDKFSIEYWLKAFYFVVETFFTIRELGGDCEIKIIKDFNISNIIKDVFLLFVSYSNRNFFDMSFDDFLRRNVDIYEFGKPKRLVQYELFNRLFMDEEWFELFNKRIEKNKLYY